MPKIGAKVHFHGWCVFEQQCAGFCVVCTVDACIRKKRSLFLVCFWQVDLVQKTRDRVLLGLVTNVFYSRSLSRFGTSWIICVDVLFFTIRVLVGVLCSLCYFYFALLAGGAGQEQDCKRFEYEFMES